MPIYEYRCESCGAELEKLQKISDPPLRDCPACGKSALAKLVSASSFRLKGSGWYETDFKTGKKKNGAAEATDGSKEGSKDSSKEAAAPGAAATPAAATTGSSAGGSTGTASGAGA